MKSGLPPQNQSAPQTNADGGPNQSMDVRYCRIRRNIKILAFTIMLSGFMCFSLFAFSFSCCAVILNPQDYEGFHPALEEDEIRYQRDLDDREVRHHHMHQHAKINPDSNNPHGLHESGRRILHSDNADEEPKYVNVGPLSHRSVEEIYAFDDEEDDTESLSDKEYDYQSKRTKSRNNLVRTSKSGTKKLPQAIIIGVKKGGTRALLEFLRIHPDVRAPGPEPHFFDRHYHKGLDWYRDQMPPTIEGQITMEKTPSYFVTKGVPGRIYNMSKNIKVIAVVRDPVTRAISDYTQALSKRPELKSFEEMAFLDNNTGLVDTSWGAIRIGVYAKHLERWLKYFPLTQMHFVNGETLIKNPHKELERVQEFLGLKRVINEKHFFFNTTKGFPCLKKPEGSGKPHCLGKTKGRTHPEVDDRVIHRLRDFFRPFNQKFYQMVGHDFGWP